MIVTNQLNLPQPLVNAIARDSYSAGDCDYSVTTLIKPVRIVSYQRRYGRELVEDAADRIFSLLGQAVHTILERAADARYVVECRYYADFGGIKVSGQIDVYDTHEKWLSDYKVTSRFTVEDGPRSEWIAQASINRLLMARNGVQVDGATIVAILRDWSKMQSQVRSGYPDRQVVVLPVPLWPLRQAEEYVVARIADHEAGRDDPPLCSPEERWESPEKWAHMRKGRKNAVKLYDSQQEALEAATGDGDRVEHRPGVPKRCLYYCPVTAHCGFGREAVAKHAGLEP